jgi:hypothetical protein
MNIVVTGSPGGFVVYTTNPPLVSSKFASSKLSQILTFTARIQTAPRDM